LDNFESRFFQATPLI